MWLTDAGHCPGSVMFLFEGAFGVYFHTGTRRCSAEVSWAEHTPLTCARVVRLQGTLDSTAACCRVPSSSGRRAWSTSCSSIPRSAHPFGLPSRPRYHRCHFPFAGQRGPALAEPDPHTPGAGHSSSPPDHFLAAPQRPGAAINQLSWLIEGRPWAAEPPSSASFARCTSNARCWARKTCWSPWQKSSRLRYTHAHTRAMSSTPRLA